MHYSYWIFRQTPCCCFVRVHPVVPVVAVEQLSAWKVFHTSSSVGHFRCGQAYLELTSRVPFLLMLQLLGRMEQAATQVGKTSWVERALSCVELGATVSLKKKKD